MKFWNYIIGPTDPALFAACIFFAGVGIFFTLLTGTWFRNPKSLGSPQGFSWGYLWSDNARRVYASIIATLLTLRFMTEVIGWELSPWKATVVGMAWDSIAFFIKQKTDILDPKPK